MKAKTQNMTGYGDFEGNEEFGKYSMNNYPDYYNQANALLHSKYHNMNQTEVPQMKFENRKGKLDLKILKYVDLKNIKKYNNIEPLEKISEQLIFSEIKDDEYNDQNIPILLKTFQYILEYLNEKQNKLVETNNKLSLEYNQLINRSYELEHKLKINKKLISENSKEKKEKEMILITYESIVNFNCNHTEKINLTTKNINKTYERGSATINYGQYNEGRFYCHICNGKFFNTESGLESHMKKRHLAQTKKDIKKEREKEREEELKEEYNKKIEDTKNYFQTLIQQKNEIFSKAKYEDEINMLKREQEEKMKNLFSDYTKQNTEQTKNMLQIFQDEQKKNNLNMINLANRAKENNEPQKIIIENSAEINALTNSITNLTDMLKQRNCANNVDNLEREKMPKDIENFENKPKILDNNQLYSFQYESRNVKKIINYNIPNNNINLNNYPKASNADPNNDNHIKVNNNINNVLQNTDISNNISNRNQPINKEFDKNENKIKENNLQNQDINNYDSINVIFGQNENKKNESIMQRQKRPEDDDDNKNKNIQNKNSINKIISESLINNNNDDFDGQNNIKNKTADNFNKNPIQLYHDENPKKNDKNNFNKTAPNGLKERVFKPLQPKKDLVLNSTMKELDTFYANFMNREQPIIENENPDPENYLKVLIPEEKRKEEKIINEDTKKCVEIQAQKQYLMNFDDFDKKNKDELFEIIDKTMQNINEINSNNKVRQLYFETAQKAIDLKLFEEDAKMMKNAYDNKGELKRSRNSSKARIVIQNAENEKFDV